MTISLFRAAITEFQSDTSFEFCNLREFSWNKSSVYTKLKIFIILGQNWTKLFSVAQGGRSLPSNLKWGARNEMVQLWATNTHLLWKVAVLETWRWSLAAMHSYLALMHTIGFAEFYRNNLWVWFFTPVLQKLWFHTGCSLKT